MTGEDLMAVFIHCLLLRSFSSLKLDQADQLCPESYKVNSPNEIQLLSIAVNFQRQYSHLYPDRKPLLLCPVNEFGVKVTLTIKLTGRVFAPSSFIFLLSLLGREMPPGPYIYMLV